MKTILSLCLLLIFTSFILNAKVYQDSSAVGLNHRLLALASSDSTGDGGDYVFPEDTVASAKKIIKISTMTDSLIFSAYGSIRINAGASFSGFSEIQNGASRIGIKGMSKITNDVWAIMQLEFGVGVVDNGSKLIYKGDPGGSIDEVDNPIKSRLGILGIRTNYGTITWGKQWSPYYNIGVFTDELNAVGGEAAGTFNRGDGSMSGTGRASFATQYTNDFGPVSVHLQMQNRTLTANNQRSADSYAGSLVYTSDFGFSFGAAFAKVLDGVDDPNLIQPKSGDESAIIGAGYKDQYVQFGLIYTIAHNHYFDIPVMDSNAVFFDNFGIELFGEYTLNNVWAAYFGYNYLKPFDSYKGQYKIDYSAVGAKYVFTNASFVFLEVKFENSLTAKGVRERPSIVAIGMYYNF
jgi:predicted porin